MTIVDSKEKLENFLDIQDSAVPCNSATEQQASSPIESSPSSDVQRTKRKRKLSAKACGSAGKTKQQAVSKKKQSKRGV